MMITPPMIPPTIIRHSVNATNTSDPMQNLIGICAFLLMLLGLIIAFND